MNRRLLCIFCSRLGPTVEDSSSIVVVLSMVPSQLNNRLFNKLVSSIFPIEKPQFFYWMCKPMPRNDNNRTCKGCVNIMNFKYDGNWYTTYGAFFSFIWFIYKCITFHVHFMYKCIMFSFVLVVYLAKYALASPYGVHPGWTRGLEITMSGFGTNRYILLSCNNFVTLHIA